MKKTILSLIALVSVSGLSYGQMAIDNLTYNLPYKNDNGTVNCLANSAPNNGAIASNGGQFVNANSSTYKVASGIELTTQAALPTGANSFNVFDFPLTTTVCSTYRGESDFGVDFSDQLNAKVRVWLHASADNTVVRFWLGSSQGNFYPATSTFNVTGLSGGMSAIQEFTIGTTATFVDLDYTGSEFTAAWNAWANKDDIDQWGLSYIGSTAGIVVTVERIQFGAALVTANNSATQVNEQVSLFPNPAKGAFNLDLSAMSVESASVKVMNANGSVVKELTASSSLPVEVSTAGLNKGIYLVQVTAENKVATKKVVVE
jgi:fibronectin-binding autotransporter adhesin